MHYDLSNSEFGLLLKEVYLHQNFGSSFLPFLGLDESLALFEYADEESLMDPSELKKVKSLPDMVTIYRGGISIEGSDSHVRNGISWTLNKSIARKFAVRNSNLIDAEDKKAPKSKPLILTGMIPKADIFAYFRGRNEQEIVCDPRQVKELAVCK
jgi:hypothetical protein